MFLNCGQVALDGGAVRIEIWDGDLEYTFRIGLPDLSTLLMHEPEEGVPVSRMFGLYETDRYGRARLTNPNPRDGRRKGVTFWFPCFRGRRFSIARDALANVARGKWIDAAVSEIIPDPVPGQGTIRMGVLR